MNQPITLSKLNELYAHMTARRIYYALGAKAPDLDIDSNKITHLDCSGFIQYAYAKCTREYVHIPAGSWNQNDFFAENNFKQVEYHDMQFVNTGRLFISTIRAHQNGAGDTGHIWFTCRQHEGQIPQTMECYYGHGVGSRPWNTRVLMTQVFQTFEIPTV